MRGLLTGIVKIGRVVAVDVHDVVLNHSEQCPVQVLECVFDAKRKHTSSVLVIKMHCTSKFFQAECTFGLARCELC